MQHRCILNTNLLAPTIEHVVIICIYKIHICETQSSLHKIYAKGYLQKNDSKQW